MRRWIAAQKNRASCACDTEVAVCAPWYGMASSTRTVRHEPFLHRRTAYKPSGLASWRHTG